MKTLLKKQLNQLGRFSFFWTFCLWRFLFYEKLYIDTTLKDYVYISLKTRFKFINTNEHSADKKEVVIDIKIKNNLI